MKKINIKNILCFVSIAILIITKIFGYWDITEDIFSLDIYGAIEHFIRIILVLAILYIICGICDLFKNSIVVSIIDFLTGILLVFSYYFIGKNSNYSYIVVIFNVIFILINILASVAMRNKNAKTNIKNNLVSTIIEIFISIVIFLVITLIASKPILDSNRGIKLNAEKLAKNISSLNINEDAYIIETENPSNMDSYYSILNEEYEEIKKYSENTNTISFAKLYKNNDYSLIGIVKDEALNKYYLVNSKMENICELEKVGNPGYLEEYLLDVLTYAIDNKLIEYNKVDTNIFMEESPRAFLYVEKEFNGEKYETEENYNYKYFENENNPNYIIQIAYKDNNNEQNDNIMEQLFNISTTTIDEIDSLYNLDRKYSLINISNGEITQLDCYNLLYDSNAKESINGDEIVYTAGIYSFANGSIPFYDGEEHGYFDLTGKKHIDDENHFTIDTYNNYNIVYNFEQEKNLIVENENNTTVKEYENIYTFKDYIIGLNDKKYEILNSVNLNKIDEYIMEDLRTPNEDSIEDEEDLVKKDEDFTNTDEEEDTDIEDIDNADTTENTENTDDTEDTENTDTTEDTENTDITEDTENTEDTEELIDEEDLEATEYVEDYTDNVTVYNEGELILLKNNLTYRYILLRYDSDKEKIEVLNEDVIELQTINKAKRSSNTFYLYKN